MKINDCLKKHYDKKIQNKYKKDGRLERWYDNNYEKNDPMWIYNELIPFMSKDREVIVLSPSANKGKYEYEAYSTFCKEGQDCVFIVSDIVGKSQGFYKNYEGLDKFNYIAADIDAKDIRLSEKADVIVDFKGAIWYSLNNKPTFSRYERFIEILKAYADNMKNDDSVLIVDAYKMNSHLHTVKNFFTYVIMRGNIKKTSKQHEELSTSYYIKKFLKRRRIGNLFSESISQNKELYSSFIRKKDLLVLIDKLEKNR